MPSQRHNNFHTGTYNSQKPLLSENLQQLTQTKTLLPRYPVSTNVIYVEVHLHHLREQSSSSHYH